ncbi:MAG: lipocalin-like domain-containing protein [Acidobacteria bacterium]|nr:lipocalin-like domain-containing protein [Acidobacteriota bacterium]
MPSMRSSHSASHCALIGVALLLGGCAGPTTNEVPAIVALPADDPGARFHGAWELASVVRYSGESEALSRNEMSTGFIMYDPAGTMGVVIQGADRQPSAEGQPTPEDRLAAYRSYTAYFGAFSVDPEAGAVTHHLRSSMNPNAAGADYVRNYEFSEDTLTLQPPADADGRTVRLTWRKLPETSTGASSVSGSSTGSSGGTKPETRCRSSGPGWTGSSSTPPPATWPFTSSGPIVSLSSRSGRPPKRPRPRSAPTSATSGLTRSTPMTVTSSTTGRAAGTRAAWIPTPSASTSSATGL